MSAKAALDGAATQTRSLGRIFAVPSLVGAASATGLLAGLVGDGAWDLAAWLGLAPAVLLPLWHGPPWGARTAAGPAGFARGAMRARAPAPPP